MSILEKAKLIRLGESSDDDEQETIPVQFNPASLRLTLSNSTEGGQSTGRPARQYSGNASTELSFDLVFDTADEQGSSGGARNVREKTAKVEQFVLAQGTGGTTRPSPPRVKFVWGGLSIVGVMSQLSIDFDLFAPTGEPLRAKMGVSIKEQDAQYALLQSESKKNAGAPPQTAGSGGGKATPGSAGGGERGSSRTGTALAGESAADFARRMGLPPDAWRGLAAGLESTVSLAAGVEIDFSASLSAQAGVGVSVGFQADAGISLEAAVGLDASTSVSAGAAFAANAGAAAGFALSAAGGVDAAVQTVAIAKAGAAADASAKAFGAGGAGGGASLSAGGGSAVASGPAAAVQAPSPAGAASSLPAAYAPPRADPRATSYGFGVPLRPRRGPAAAASAGVVALRPYASAATPPATRDPTVPAWAGLPVLPPSPPAVPAAGGAPKRKGGRIGCGCGCGPHGGGR
jgi:hypothetical protein